MKFGRVALADAAGALLGHSVSAGKLRLKKGHLLGPAELEALRAAGIASVFAGRLDPDDVPENEAATTVASAARGVGTRLNAAFTGRANLYAETAGVALIDAACVDALNLIDEAVTIATVPPNEAVEAGQMLATIKIIPFAVPRAVVAQAAKAATDLVRVAGFKPHRVGLICSALPDTKPSVLDKTEVVMAQRVSAMGSTLVERRRVAHDETAIAAALRDLAAAGCAPIVVVGASAIVDRHDVVPLGLITAGGSVEHFGMPVDPGNLLLLGRLGDTVVLCAPGCARSPKLNGFDWVLQRLMAGLSVGRAEIMRMGAGGLLKEISSRGLPRDTNPAPAPRMPRIAAIVLAAGRSSRMRGSNKLLLDVAGKPMVTHAVDALLASAARPVVVVTGHQETEVRAALAGHDVGFAANPAYADGLSTSLRAGLAALPHDVDGVLVFLGDMPLVRARHIDQLIAAFNPAEGRAICVPTHNGKRGNPVLWGSQFYAEMKALAGDVGARHLIGEHAELVREVPVDDDAVLADFDTPEAMLALTR